MSNDGKMICKTLIRGFKMLVALLEELIREADKKSC